MRRKRACQVNNRWRYLYYMKKQAPVAVKKQAISPFRSLARLMAPALISAYSINDRRQNGCSPSRAAVRRPHALLLPYPAQGHINPFMQLGKRLAALGVRVTLVNMEHTHARILRAQQGRFLISDNLRLVGIPDGLPTDFNREVWGDELWHAIENNLQGPALELVHKLALQGEPVTCVVGDFFLCWTRILALKAHLPEFVFFPQCASAFSIYSHIDAIISSGYDPFEANVKASGPRPSMDLLNGIPGFSRMLHPADLPFESPFGKLGLKWMKEVINYRFSHIGEAAGVIGNSFEDLEPEVCKVLANQLRVVGPLLPLAFLGDKSAELTHGSNKSLTSGGASLWKEEEEESMQWLAMQPPSSVIYVAFGSLTRSTVEQVHELALGLAASNQRFLWVIRKGSVAHRAADTDLEAILPQGFLEETKERGKVIRWAPQSLVLSHGAVGGFFSHCGWNSTLESICAGVPILGWPWVMDQVTNCWLVCNQWKVGLQLQRDADNKAKRGDIESAVRELMEGPTTKEMRGQATKLRDSARNAIVKSARWKMQSFVDDICKASSR